MRHWARDCWARGRFASGAPQLGKGGHDGRREGVRDGAMLSTLAIMLIVVGSIISAGILRNLLWPTIAPMLRKPASVPLTARLARGSDPVPSTTGAQAAPELPPLFAPV